MANDLFGNIKSPYSSAYDLCSGGGPTLFLSNLIKLVMVAAGLFAFINLLLAGFIYIGSSGDPKKVASAMQKINLSLIGLLIMVASFALAVIISQLLFGNPTAILTPTIYGPGAACP